MSRIFEELDRQPTPMGDISVRRRFHPTLQVDVWEVILGDEHLMSNIFTAAEIALADLGLAATTTTDLDVVVGGLGLGYTADGALRDTRVRHLTVVDGLAEVIGWHEAGFLPLGNSLATQPRCELVHGDFFAMVRERLPFGDTTEAMTHDAILVDIDHTPTHVLHPSHAPFYEAAGLRRLAERLNPGGVFALWSDDPPDDTFVETLASVFSTACAEVVRFPNPLTGGEASNTIYVATVER